MKSICITSCRLRGAATPSSGLPPRSRGDYRREEWIAHGVPPAEVDRLARARTRGGFAICAIRAVDEPEDPLRDGYKALGYRLGTTEPMMIPAEVSRYSQKGRL